MALRLVVVEPGRGDRLHPVKRDVDLVAFGGSRRVIGFRNLVDGGLPQ